MPPSVQAAFSCPEIGSAKSDFSSVPSRFNGKVASAMLTGIELTASGTSKRPKKTCTPVPSSASEFEFVSTSSPPPRRGRSSKPPT